MKFFNIEPRRGHNARIKESENNYHVSKKNVDYDFIDNLKFEKDSNKLSFILKHYHQQPKITRYVTVNYERTPIYEDYSVREKTKKKFSRIINPYRFVNEEILEIQDLTLEHGQKIINAIGIKPHWLVKLENIKLLKKEIRNNYKARRNFEDEKKRYSLKFIGRKEQPGNFWLRLFFAGFTFGLSFIGYISKKRSFWNRKLNKECQQWNEKHIIEVDNENKRLQVKIDSYNQKLKEKRKKLGQDLKIEKQRPIILTDTDKEGWINLRNAVNFSNQNLNNKKGVYVIKNKTKNKHYIGQSKNLKTRIFSQHFNKGEVKNIVFAKDWFNNDDFFLKYFICQTKDELDAKEKEMIELYNAFAHGYNKTGGNK